MPSCQGIRARVRRARGRLYAAQALRRLRRRRASTGPPSQPAPEAPSSNVFHQSSQRHRPCPTCSAGFRPRSRTATASSARSAPAAWPRCTSPQDLRHDRRGRAQGPPARAGRRDRGRALPGRDQAHGQPPAPAHPAAVRLGRGRRLPVLRHALRRGRDAARPAHPREAAPGAPRRSGSPPRSPRRSTTRTATAWSTATSSPRTSCCTTARRWWPTSASRSPPARRAAPG